MDWSTWFDGSFQQPEPDFDALLNAAVCARFPLTPSMPLNGVPPADPGKTASSLEGALKLEYIPRYHPYYPPPPKRSPIHNVPVEILIRIFQFVAPPRTRDGLYALTKLSHVCRFWRMALINQRQLWSAVFITQDDRRSFVQACLHRSYPVALDITVEARTAGNIHLDCTCDKGPRERLMPNESNPCEWHFQFELLAESNHYNRIRALDIEFDDWDILTGKARFALGSCRFFTLTFPMLVSLTWKNEGASHADHLFATPPFSHTLCSLNYVGDWNSLIAQIKNLTSFSFEFSSDLRPSKINMEAFRLLMCNNRLLESIYLKWVELEGDAKGPPVHLLNLKSLTLNYPPKRLVTIIRIPAFQRLSSLRISSEDAEDAETYTISATGHEISITTKCFLDDFAEIWDGLTGYAKPVIRHIRLYDGPKRVDHCYGDNITVALLMVDAQTLEVGLNYLMGWYRSFWEDLKQLGTQLKTIRFEVSGDMEPCPEFDCVHDDFDCAAWDSIEDLVKHRFGQARPFSVVERLVVSENERDNRLQAYVWRCFYGTRNLAQYVRPVQD